MDIAELLRRQDLDIAAAERESEAAQERAMRAAKEAAEVYDHLNALRIERATLEQAARRYGAVDQPLADVGTVEIAPAFDWTTMNRLDAVERVLQQRGMPLHINDIVTVLAQYGRTGDTYQLISATLSTLRTRRGSVRPVGGGRWVFGPPPSGAQIMEKLARRMKEREERGFATTSVDSEDV